MKADEQGTERVQKEREEYLAKYEHVPVERFVFLDEAGVSTKMTRPCGRSLQGYRCYSSAPYNWKQSVTMIGAVSVKGMLAACLFEGPMNGPLFLEFVQKMLVPTLEPGQFVVMDNLSSHKVAGVREAIEAAMCEAVYLPPYSPDLNPIENCWSSIKWRVKSKEPRTQEEVFEVAGAAMLDVTPQQVKNAMRHAGYIINSC